MAKITKRTVDALTPSDRDVFKWDSELRGFGVRLKPSGALSYLVQYRNQQGRSRRLTVGSHGRLTTEEARKEARLILSEVEKGNDPAGERSDFRSAPTVSELCDRFLNDHAKEHKKSSSVESDERNIRNHIKPLIGHLNVADIKRADIDRLRHAVKSGKTRRTEKKGPHSKVIVKGGQGVANRCLALLSKMFNVAEKWGLRPDGSNPCRHVEKYRERKVERYLSADELSALGTALAEMESEGVEAQAPINAIRLLLFTGCRLSEILTLKWDWVDFEDTCLHLPDSKSGAKVVYLPAPALAILQAIKREKGNPFVIPGTRRRRSDKAPATHLVNLQQPWRRVRERASVVLWRQAAAGDDSPLASLMLKLEKKKGRTPTFNEVCEAAKLSDLDLPTGMTDVRLHDLRHSFASVAVAAGEGLHMIGKLLGHTQTQTTHRYAHLAADPMKAAAERVGMILAAAIDNKGGEVIQLDRTAKR